MSEAGELVKCSLIRRPLSAQKRSLTCDPRTLCVWNDMKCTILEIMRQETSKEVITDTVYNAVRLPLMRNSDYIYADLYGYLEGIVDCIAENLLENTENEFLHKLLEGWNKYKFSIALISNLFPILDGVVSRETDCTFVNFGRTIFETCIFQHEVIRDHTTRCLLSMVEDERRGVLMDRALFTQTCFTLKFMSICDDRRYKSFEKKFLDESKVYYKKKCQELLSTNDTYEYLSRVETVLNREERRLSFCFKENTARANILLAEKELIHRRLNDIVTLESNGIMELLMENKIPELALLYKVLRRVLMGKTVIADYVHLFLEKRTRQLLKDMEFLSSDSVIDSVLETGDKINVMVEACFRNDKFLKTEVCLAFRKYVTCDEKFGLFLAEYTDDLLRNVNRAYEPDVDVKLSKLFRVKSFLPWKDAVQSLYKIYLSGRLLLGGPVYYEELAAVQMQFVVGKSLMDVRGMLQDIRRSDILSDMYGKHPKVMRPSGRAPACEFSMKLLSSAFWPLIPPSKSNVVLPSRPMCHYINFSNFYKVLAASRKLILMPQYGTAEILVFETDVKRRHSRVSFPSFPSLSSDESSLSQIVIKSIVCKMEVSTVQMCILTLFNNSEKLTVKDIRKQTNIASDLLRAALRPLCDAKVLLTNDEPEKYDTFSEFTVNPDLYSTRLLKLFGKSQIDHFKSIRDENSAQVDRQVNTDIVILRIMKVNGVLSHNTLVSKTINILKNSMFVPTSLFVTKRINSLMQRNMLKRSPQNYDIYSFE